MGCSHHNQNVSNRKEGLKMIPSACNCHSGDDAAQLPPIATMDYSLIDSLIDSLPGERNEVPEKDRLGIEQVSTLKIL